MAINDNPTTMPSIGCIIKALKFVTTLLEIAYFSWLFSIMTVKSILLAADSYSLRSFTSNFVSDFFWIM
jgi:hypothetical protein